MVNLPVEPPVKRSWRASASGWIAGRRVEEGAVVELTEAEAKYEPVEQLPSAAGKPASRRRAEAGTS